MSMLSLPCTHRYVCRFKTSVEHIKYEANVKWFLFMSHSRFFRSVPSYADWIVQFIYMCVYVYENVYMHGNWILNKGSKKMREGTATKNIHISYTTHFTEITCILCCLLVFYSILYCTIYEATTRSIWIDIIIHALTILKAYHLSEPSRVTLILFSCGIRNYRFCHTNKMLQIMYSTSITMKKY